MIDHERPPRPPRSPIWDTLAFYTGVTAEHNAEKTTKAQILALADRIAEHGKEVAASTSVNTVACRSTETVALDFGNGRIVGINLYTRVTRDNKPTWVIRDNKSVSVYLLKASGYNLRTVILMDKDQAVAIKPGHLCVVCGHGIFYDGGTTYHTEERDTLTICRLLLELDQNMPATKPQ